MWRLQLIAERLTVCVASLVLAFTRMGFMKIAVLLEDFREYSSSN